VLKEEASYGLARTFIEEYKKFGRYLFSMKTVDKSKWWVHFERAAGYRSIEGWTPEIHVKSCFEKYGIILPFRLFGKTAIEAWEEYHHRFEEKKTNNFIVQMLDTYNRMKKQYGGYNPDFFKENLLLIKRGILSIHFLSLSKTFRELNKEKGFYDTDMLDIKRQVVCTNKKVFNKMKELFKDDFYRGET